jgi:hypothetical protein
MRNNKIVTLPFCHKRQLTNAAERGRGREREREREREEDTILMMSHVEPIKPYVLLGRELGFLKIVTFLLVGARLGLVHKW